MKIIHKLSLLILILFVIQSSLTIAVVYSLSYSHVSESFSKNINDKLKAIHENKRNLINQYFHSIEDNLKLISQINNKYTDDTLFTNIALEDFVKTGYKSCLNNTATDSLYVYEMICNQNFKSFLFSDVVKSNNNLVAVSAFPIIKFNKNIGYVYGVLNYKTINKLMTENNNWEKYGLGKTGENYIVGLDHKFRTESRFTKEAILNEKVNTNAVTDAVKSSIGFGVFKDYRGIKVFSVFSIIEVSQIKWIIISEADYIEIMHDLLILKEKYLFSIFMLLFVFLLLAIVITYILIRPLKKIIDIEEIKQQQLGQELHDNIAQEMLGISFLIKAIQQKIKVLEIDTAIKESLQKTEFHLDKCIEKVRTLSHQLIPAGININDLNLSFQQLKQDLTDSTNINFEIEMPENYKLKDKNKAFNIYQIAKEAVVNAIKHGAAMDIIISIYKEQNYDVLEIFNNGKLISNFGQNKLGLGLRMMELRAKTIGGFIKLENINTSNKTGVTLKCYYHN